MAPGRNGKVAAVQQAAPRYHGLSSLFYNDNYDENDLESIYEISIYFNYKRPSMHQRCVVKERLPFSRTILG